MYNPYEIVKMFEANVAEYAGSKYACAVDNCTDALFLCCKYLKVEEVIIPKRTYLSVPQAIIHAGGNVKFSDIKWSGVYQLSPYPIYDSSKRFRKGMYIKDSFYCLSFHIKKHLPIGKGGMILTNDKKALKWFKIMRYEGRHEKVYKNDYINYYGWNMYMTPEQAARGLMLLQNLPNDNPDLQEDYPDLTKLLDINITLNRRKNEKKTNCD